MGFAWGWRHYVAPPNGVRSFVTSARRNKACGVSLPLTPLIRSFLNLLTENSQSQHYGSTTSPMQLIIIII